MRSTRTELFNLNQNHPSKIWGFFWLKLYKIQVMITSLKEKLESPNFSYMTTPTI